MADGEIETSEKGVGTDPHSLLEILLAETQSRPTSGKDVNSFLKLLSFKSIT